jgi:serine/threonine protein kinase
LAHLHNQGIIHRDIHPQRFQLFSVAKFRVRNEADIQAVSFAPSTLKFNTIGLPFNFKKLLKRENFSGHVNYSPPELIMEQANFSSKVDVWSFGCCIYYMINKKDPFDGRNPNETKNNILNLRTDRHMTLYDFIKNRVSSPLLKYFLESCLSYKPEHRPSFHRIVEIIDHEYPQFAQAETSQNM